MPSSFNLNFCFWTVCLWTLSSHFSNASAFSSAFAKLSATTTKQRAFLLPREQQHKQLWTGPIWAVARGGDQTEEPLTETKADSISVESEEAQEVEPEPVVTAHSESGTVDETLVKKAGFGGVAMIGQKVLGTFSQFYTQNLDKFPIITKSVTAGVIFGLSDFLAQKIEQQNSSVRGDSKNKKKKGGLEPTKSFSMDWTRLMASALVGLLYFGPAAHYWYEAIFRLLPGTSLVSTLQKAFWGQVLFGPSFNCIFFATSLLQSGKFSLRNWGEKIRSDLPGAWLAGAGFWPLVDVISYSMVPVKWIPLFINFCSLVWTIYLSIVANRDSRTKAETNK